MAVVQLKVIDLMPADFAKPCSPSERMTQPSPRTKHPMLSIVSKPAEVPESADCDSMSTRTVSSRGAPGKAPVMRPAVMSRRALNAILRNPETSWRFLHPTGDFAAAATAPGTTVPSRSLVATEAPPPAPIDTSAAPVAAGDAALSAVAIDHAEDALTALLTNAGRTSVRDVDIVAEAAALRSRLGIPSPPQPTSKLRATPHSSLSVPSVMSRDSRLAFLAKLPSCKFVADPSPRQMQRTVVTEELRRAVPKRSQIRPSFDHQEGGRFYGEVDAPCAVAETLGVAVGAPQTASEPREGTNGPSTSCQLVTSGVVPPAAAHSDLDDLMVQLQNHRSAPAGHHHGKAGSSHDVHTVAVPQAVLHPDAAADHPFPLPVSSSSQPRTPLTPLTDASHDSGNMMSSASMAAVPNSRGLKKRGSLRLTTASMASKSEDAIPASRRFSEGHAAHQMLMAATTGCETALLEEVPLVVEEVLPFEVELPVRMELRRLYIALHPLDAIVPASNLPNELVSVLAVTHRGVPVPLLHEKHLTNGVASDIHSVAPPMYVAACRLDSVEYRQWHREPGYVDPSRLIGTRDYNERCQLLTMLRAKQREAEIRFGIAATYTKIPPPLLHDEELGRMASGPQPPELVSPQQSSRSPRCGGGGGGESPRQQHTSDRQTDASIPTFMGWSKKKAPKFDPTLTQEIRRTGKVLPSSLAVLSRTRVQFLEEVAARLPNTVLFDAFASVNSMPGSGDV